jgi:cell pole-organizing protein PopZ
MEEILASIRRIISEDEPTADAAAPAAEPEPEPVVHPEPEPEIEAHAIEEDDVLELTQLAPEPDPMIRPVETVGDLEVHVAPPLKAPAYEPPAYDPPAAKSFGRAAVVEEPLMSPSPAESAASAFGHLAHTVAMPSEGRVLEDVVRELLRPLLKAWLDEHLPAIVQAKVEEEVERIARRRVS